jgi:hypothetical protein
MDHEQAITMALVRWCCGNIEIPHSAVEPYGYNAYRRSTIRENYLEDWLLNNGSWVMHTSAALNGEFDMDDLQGDIMYQATQNAKPFALQLAEILLLSKGFSVDITALPYIKYDGHNSFTMPGVYNLELVIPFVYSARTITLKIDVARKYGDWSELQTLEPISIMMTHAMQSGFALDDPIVEALDQAFTMEEFSSIALYEHARIANHPDLDIDDEQNDDGYSTGESDESDDDAQLLGQPEEERQRTERPVAFLADAPLPPVLADGIRMRREDLAAGVENGIDEYYRSLPPQICRPSVCDP